MTYVRDMDSNELIQHMDKINKIKWWNDPLVDRLYSEIESLNKKKQDY